MIRRRLRMALPAVVAALVATGGVAAPRAPALLDFTADERASILSHGPWPPAVAVDTSNRVMASPAAAALGRRLFFEARLSDGAGIACATCHIPARAFQDSRPVAQGAGAGTRNTPGLLDSAHRRWFGWDGASDSLWAASLRPIVSPQEMRGSAPATARLVRGDARLAAAYRQAFGALPADDEAVLVGVAKALAAYQATLRSPRTAFDHFRDALERGDHAAAARYPLAAQRGLRLFVGEGRCQVCHAGPHFTNGEFADVGVPFFVPGGADPGRFGGIRALRESRYNRLGPFADDGGADAVATRHVELAPRHFGEFKVPGLRGLVDTAPYMHDGQLATLADVIRHYSELDPSRLHADGERILRPLKLSPQAASDLEAFLRTLSR